MSFVIFHKVTKKFVSLQTFATKFLNEKDTYNRRIGLHWLLIVEEALRRGMETWAVVRRTSSREYLQDERIHFIELDFSSVDKLKEQLSGHQF